MKPIVIMLIFLACTPLATIADERHTPCRFFERGINILENIQQRGWFFDRYFLEYQIDVFSRKYVDHCLHINEVQTLGTHNSYHRKTPEFLFDNFLSTIDPSFATLRYEHRPLEEQFDEFGIRHIELDVFLDPEGSLFSDRKLFQLFGMDTASGIPELENPGLKVMHIEELDFETHYPTFIQALQALKRWSDAHPDHMPIMVMVEAKDPAVPDFLGLGFAQAIPFSDNPAGLVEIENEIRTVFSADRLLTPDDVRKPGLSLNTSILQHGWPTVGTSRGKILFTLCCSPGVENQGTSPGQHRDEYINGDPDLVGRVLFPASIPGADDAAFIMRDDPVAGFEEIKTLVEQGYLVRTRSDANLIVSEVERDLAIESGAQYISTDFPEPDLAIGPFYVELPEADPGVCNPVNAPSACRNAGLE